MSETRIPAALRRFVRERALERCEYCLIPERFSLVTHSIDHIIAVKHGGPTGADNLALACATCNRHKGSDLTSVDPQSKAIVPLYHPRRDTWLDHFTLKGSRIEGLSPSGRATVRLFRFNYRYRSAERELLVAAGALLPVEGPGTT